MATNDYKRKRLTKTRSKNLDTPFKCSSVEEVERKLKETNTLDSVYFNINLIRVNSHLFAQDVKVDFRLPKILKEQYKEVSKITKKDLGSLVRSAMVDQQVEIIDNTDLFNLAKDLNKIGSNLNQLTRYFNTENKFNNDDLMKKYLNAEELSDTLKEFKELKRKINQKLTEK